MSDTIFALSSGAPPAAIAVVRVSGPAAGEALRALCGRLPPPRRASARRLADPRTGEALDDALVLWLPGPRSATGEDIAELHLHGGRAVVRAVEAVLATLPGLRPARPGEFTRRAFLHGRIDLAEAEGLADLLSAETELQRRTALAAAGGALSREVERWRGEVLALSAQVEAALDFAGDDDIDEGLDEAFFAQAERLASELDDWLSRPRAEPLREGFRVVLAGPPNAGKSTLFNALTEEEASITSAEPGTTRDVLVRSVAIDGVAFTFVDTAGLREDAASEIESIGIARARAETERSDLVLWLGPAGEGPRGVALREVAAQADVRGWVVKPGGIAVSALTGEGMDALRAELVATARAALPRPGAVALNARQHSALAEVAGGVRQAAIQVDPLIGAEHLRVARAALDRLAGRAGTEAMLDALFGRFCIGK